MIYWVLVITLLLAVAFVRWQMKKQSLPKKATRLYQLVPISEGLSKEAIENTLNEYSIRTVESRDIRLSLHVLGTVSGVKLIIESSEENIAGFMAVLREEGTEFEAREVLSEDWAGYNRLLVTRNNIHLKSHPFLPLIERGADFDPLSKAVNELSGEKEYLLSLHLSPYSSRSINSTIRLILETDRRPLVLRLRFFQGSLLYLYTSLVGLVQIFFSVLVHNRHSGNKYSVSNPKAVDVLDKLHQPLYEARMHILSTGLSENKAGILRSAFSSFRNNHQRLIFTDNKNPIITLENGLADNIGRSGILSAQEIAGMFHVPLDHSRKLFESGAFKPLTVAAADRSSYSSQDSDATSIGLNQVGNERALIRLDINLRKAHTLIVGSTGTGKSSLMGDMIRQDLLAGRGLTLIDPHGDLSSDILEHIPDFRKKDLVVFDPSTKNCPGLNLLSLSNLNHELDPRIARDNIIESVVSIFKRLVGSEEFSGHRIEYILRSSILTAFEIPGSDIYTVYKLLTDTTYRIRAVNNLKNTDLQNFWKNEIGRAGDFQRVKMTAGVTSKIGRLLFSPSLRNVFRSSADQLDIAGIMDDKKILIARLPKGQLGEDNSRLLSMVLLSKLQLSSLARSGLEDRLRTDHYLYLDEFQSVASNSLVEMLAESRKFKLYLTIAEQSLAQQENTYTNLILANVGNFLSFRTLSLVDENKLMGIMGGMLKAGDLSSLPNYHFYMRSFTDKPLSVISGITLPPQVTTKDKQKVSGAYSALRAIA